MQNLDKILTDIKKKYTEIEGYSYSFDEFFNEERVKITFKMKDYLNIYVMLNVFELDRVNIGLKRHIESLFLKELKEQRKMKRHK